MRNNEHLEEFKINIVKRYLNGEEGKKLCLEYGIAKSTLWGWKCKYQNLIEKEWELKPVKSENAEYIDITRCIKTISEEPSIEETGRNSIRIFKNGYSIITHIENLKKVLEVIRND